MIFRRFSMISTQFSTFLKHFTHALALTALLTGCGPGGGTQAAPAAVSEERIAELRAESAAFSDRSAEELLADPAALAVGKALRDAHCAHCHGADGGRPARGTPDLAASAFDYGDTAEAVRTTITQGRHSVMPKFGGQMGEVDLGALTSYVQAVATGENIGSFQASAERLYAQHCVACHGADGRGNRELGAADFGDDYWQHGNNMMNVRLAITRGVESDCPAHGDELAPAEIELLTAYVLSLRAG